ncbi:hypothetical protein GQ55_5G064300 [Panicum hallii var. hallii]|uniref:Uncharacterized protein n=1 Tax=Panicum hallii var. hallii TaxID=1504633 RepID=A0A2T7DDC8_9POAL|nr:hypothetical protein GQ55_5G064300 [Panicum hallii var. hallii]
MGNWAWQQQQNCRTCMPVMEGDGPPDSAPSEAVTRGKQAPAAPPCPPLGSDGCERRTPARQPGGDCKRWSGGWIDPVMEGLDRVMLRHRMATPAGAKRKQPEAHSLAARSATC